MAEIGTQVGVVVAGDGAHGARVARPPALELVNLSKTFPGVRAIDDISLTIAAGTVHALVGQNGCGKSTTIKVLSGFHKPDPGADARLDGEPFALGSSDAAAARGVRFVFQDLGLVAELDALDNIGLGLGYPRRQARLIDWSAQRRRTRELLSRFGVAVDPRAPLGSLSPLEQTAVAVVRAVAGGISGRGLLVLDEPTAALGHREVDQLYRLVREVRDAGTAVLLVSHRLDEVLAIADDVSVMRTGKIVGRGAVSDMTVPRLAGLIAGSRSVTGVAERAQQRRARTAPALEVEGLAGRFLRGLDLSVGRGEIVGVAGLLGSGREELGYAVAGVSDPPATGVWSLGGQRLISMTPNTAAEHGMVFVPASRESESAFHELDVRENLLLAALPRLRRGPLVSARWERPFAREWLGRMRVRLDSMDAPFARLSGGNQQKVVLGRWLAIEPQILIMSEPTAGVDIGARQVLYDLLKERAREGLSILMASSDVQDLLHVCDRIIVLRDGRAVRELEGPDVTEPAIISAMEGA
jgi:ribose transport system ATP-binding protein